MGEDFSKIAAHHHRNDCVVPPPPPFKRKCIRQGHNKLTTLGSHTLTTKPLLSNGHKPDV